MKLKDLVKNVCFDELLIYKENLDGLKKEIYIKGEKIHSKYLNCNVIDFKIWNSYDRKLVLIVAINWI